MHIISSQLKHYGENIEPTTGSKGDTLINGMIRALGPRLNLEIKFLWKVKQRVIKSYSNSLRAASTPPGCAQAIFKLHHSFSERFQRAS